MRDCNARHEIRRAGARSGNANARFAAGTRIAIRGMGRALLMGGADVVDPVPVLIQRVINIEYRAAGIPEYGIHSLLQQAFHNNLCPCQYHNPFLLTNFFQSFSTSGCIGNFRFSLPTDKIKSLRLFLETKAKSAPRYHSKCCIMQPLMCI